MNLDKEISFRFKPLAWIKKPWAGPGLTITAFGFWWFLFAVEWNDIDWPSWVQAIGSVGAILVAVRVADRARADLQKQRDDEIAKKAEADRMIDQAHAVRLDAFVAQTNVALRMLLDYQGIPKPVRLGSETVDVYRAIAQRMQVAFDNDTDLVRMRIITKLRFNLSSVLHQLQSREGKFLDALCFEVLQDMLEAFTEYRDQLQRCSGMDESYSRVASASIQSRPQGKE